MRRAAAVLAGKATGMLSRLGGQGGGTSLPGEVARAIDPDVLRKLAGDLRQGSIVITGTNGKTTTARLIAWLLEGKGATVVANRAGANLIRGATSAALNSAGLTGRLKADWGVFEIDEASLPYAVDELSPKAAVVLNLFRDQLDRYGELETIARTIERALTKLPDDAHAILNADDPRVGEIGLNLAAAPTWFGLDDPSVASKELPHAADARTCPRCGSSLEFSAVYLGHDGIYACPNHDFARPTPELTASNIKLDGFDGIEMTVGAARLKLGLGGLYNCYNVLAAYAVGRAVGLEADYIAERINGFRAAFGRQERIEVRGRRLNLVLSKNPTGFNETLRTAVSLANGKYFLIALNDRRADGTDVSWIWDVDFELLRDHSTALIPSGTRAHDLAVRFKYGDVKAESPQPAPGAALDVLLEAVPKGETAHILCTYTAMLDLRDEIVRRGWARRYWET